VFSGGGGNYTRNFYIFGQIHSIGTHKEEILPLISSNNLYLFIKCPVGLVFELD
jgi:hypothetical protein